VCESRKAWTYAKRALSFPRVTQDGDEEGVLTMDRLLTADEAEVIRDYLGIAKRPDVSEEERERHRSFGERLRKKFPFAGGAGIIPFGGRGSGVFERWLTRRGRQWEIE
jgi:hypothetical protein